MNAANFYASFDEAFSSSVRHVSIKRMASSQSKWKVTLPEGSLLLSFSTNAKVAGLLPHWPGEFRSVAKWTHGKKESKKTEDVSLFQYLTTDEIDALINLQNQALDKFFAQPPSEDSIPNLENLLRPIPSIRPAPNIEPWLHYFDRNDATAWGEYFGEKVSLWIERFLAAPESRDAWCWRVLWPHLKNKG